VDGGRWTVDGGRQTVDDHQIKKGFFKNLILVGGCFLLFFFPYKTIITKIQDSSPFTPLEREGRAIRQLNNDHPEISSYKILMTVKEKEHQDQANFYIKAYNHFKDKNLKLINRPGELRVGDSVLCCQKENIDSVKALFSTKEILELDECVILELISGQ